MSGLLPSESDTTARGGGNLRLLWLDDEEAETLIGSLSSETARAILTALHDRPLTASELADEVDTSLQNIRHHLGNLQEADLVRVSDTRYSVKGREMNVYAPVEDSLVVCVGRQDDRSSFFDSLKRIIGAVTALGVLSLLVQWAFGAGAVDLGGPGSAPRVGDSVGGTAEPLLGVLSPGLAFFAGGLLVLALLLLWDYRSSTDRAAPDARPR